MIVLSIDTCGPSGSIALGSVEPDAVEVLVQTELAGKTYSAQLVPVLRTMLQKQQQEQGVDVSALDAIVVVNGPGSFTGIRIGVSSAKGLAAALDIPVLAVSRLAALAWKAQTHCSALDAGRSEFYFRDGNREFLLGAKNMPLTSIESTAVCEPTAERAFANAVLVTPPNASDAIRYSVPRLLACDFSDLELLDGNYVRRSDAEIFAKVAGRPD